MLHVGVPTPPRQPIELAPRRLAERPRRPAISSCAARGPTSERPAPRDTNKPTVTKTAIEPALGRPFDGTAIVRVKAHVGTLAFSIGCACASDPRSSGDAFESVTTGGGGSEMGAEMGAETNGASSGVASGSADSEGTGSGACSSASCGETTRESSDGSEEVTVTSDDEGFKFDTPPAVTDGGNGNGDGSCGCGNGDWSYVWIANTDESTVSKVNTRTLVEEGRYITRPDKAGSPSRTSVSIDGKAVAVANRHVGIVKIWTRPEFCKGGNTSTGSTDVKAWGTDDCVAWYTDFPGDTVQRPVAWTQGSLDPATCTYVDQKIWTTTGTNAEPGLCGVGGIWVHRLNGDTGKVENTRHIPDEDFSCDFVGYGDSTSYGPYGGAVDWEGNFWFQGFEVKKLVRVDFDTLDYEIFPASGTFAAGYGITVDTKARVWLSDPIRRFDYATGTWASSVGPSTGGGIAQDLQGRIWAAGNNGLTWVDMETLATGGTVALPAPGFGGAQVKGVSVDIDGFIWAVYINDTRAYKIDPNTFTLEWYEGLNGPYTYSDMTGGQISNVECNPPEG